MILFKNAIANIKAYKLRIFMAMIWIILGVVSVVVVSSISKGLEVKIKDISNNSKDRKGIIHFYPNDYRIMDVALVFQPFSRAEIEAINLMDGVKGVITDENKNDMGGWGSEVTVDGKVSYPQFEALKKGSKYNVVAGRDLTYGDDGRKVILLDQQAAIELFESPEAAVGVPLSLEGAYYEVIGVIQDAGNGYGVSYMPKETFDILTGSNGFYNEFNPSVTVEVLKGFDKSEILNNVVTKLNEMKGDKDGIYEMGWDENGPDEFLYIKDIVNRFSSLITYVLLGIGGVGIMNVMYMSVVERKREIGIRRAIGAKRRSILSQFVIESTIITFLGGVLGVIIGIIASNYISNSGKLPFPAVIDVKSSFFALILAIMTGIIFGLIPAFKASRVDPIKAIQG